MTQVTKPKPSDLEKHKNPNSQQIKYWMMKLKKKSIIQKGPKQKIAIKRMRIKIKIKDIWKDNL